MTHAHKEIIKLISTVFYTIVMQELWNEKGFILVNFFPRETAVKSNQYIQAPRSLKAYPCWVCPITNVSELLILRDNIRPHKNIPCTEGVTDCGWKILPNKFCSSKLSGNQYIDDEALQNTAYQWLQSLYFGSHDDCTMNCMFSINLWLPWQESCLCRVLLTTPDTHLRSLVLDHLGIPYLSMASSWVVV
jgi:hypothetical protein